MAASLAKSVGTQALLNRILESPEQVAALQHLQPPVLARLIHHVGLEDSGELVALASAQQLARIFDDDLWRSTRPGQEERFDAERFGLWLEVMLEMGADRAAQKLTEMDEDFLTLALSHHILVMDLEELVLRHRGHREGRLDPEALVDKALESSLSQELGKYLVVARHPDGWDAVLAVLLALDEQHHDFLVGLLERSCYLSSEYIEDNGGLYHVLTASEQLAGDVASDREDRRAREGFVAPQAAASFLALARMGRAGEDAITQAYWRSLESTPPPSDDAGRPAGSEGVAPLTHLLQEAEVLPAQPPVALLGAGDRAGDTGTPALLREALGWLREEDAHLLSRRMRELGYLSNVLLAGASHDGRALRAVEAAQAAVAVCNLGLERHLAREGVSHTAGHVLVEKGLVELFGVGWQALHEEAVAWTARALVEALARKGPSLPGEAARVRVELERNLAAGRPWDSRKRLRLLAPLLPRGAMELLRGLIDECPSFEGTFIATSAQLEHIHLRVAECVQMT
jgi:uncharacterized protein DUF6178